MDPDAIDEENNLLLAQPQPVPFPDNGVDPQELLFFRNWQASGLVKVVYYFIIVWGIIQFVRFVFGHLEFFFFLSLFD